MIRFERGVEPIRRLLRTKLHDLRAENPETFPGWIGRHLRAWAVDPVFQQRIRIREIRRNHSELQALEQERHAARTDFEAAAEYQRHETLRRELAGAENAVAGLAHAVGKSIDDDEGDRLREKLGAYESMVAALGDQLASLREESPCWQRLHAIAARLAEVRADSGFDAETSRLAELHRSHGRSGGRSGVAFEAASADFVRSSLIPELQRKYGASDLLLLNRVRLSTSRAEFDHLVVRPRSDPLRPVTVLAAVESKRNPNDLAHGLRQRKENLDWFLGRSERYDPEEYRTSFFTEGHFDRPAVHVEDGRRYVFGRDSFAPFEEDPFRDTSGAHLPRALYLVSRPSTLWGIGSGGLARIGHRVSSDMGFDLSATDYVSSLLEWARRLTHDLEAPDLLELLAGDEDAAGRLILLSVDTPAPRDG